MKHRRIFIVSLLALVVIGTLGVYWRRWSGPWYEGRSLHAWLEEGARKWEEGGENNGGNEACIAEAEAVRHIGTNAIPALLRMFRAKDSPVTEKLQTLHYEKFHFLPCPPIAYYEHDLAEFGFVWLGADATNAIPDLMEIYRSNTFQTSEMAYGILLNLLPPAEKSALLHEGLTNEFDGVRSTALCELADANPPEVAVPLLITGLSDSRMINREIASMKLCELGTNALSAVPALVPLAAMSVTNSGYNPARETLIELEPVTAAKVLGEALTNDFGSYERFTNRLANGIRERMEVQKVANSEEHKPRRGGRVEKDK